MANKAVNKGYTEDPFYKLDKRYSGTRYIAWAGDKEQQAQLFWLLTDIIGPRIEYLFKIEIDISSDGIIWQRIYGGILYDDLKCIIESDEGLFFQDCGFQICLRIPDSDDYFTYDEHGVFWIYSDNIRFHKAFEESELSEKDAPLIFDSSHWHYRPKDAANRLEKFIEYLIDSSIFYEREDTNYSDAEDSVPPMPS